MLHYDIQVSSPNPDMNSSPSWWDEYSKQPYKLAMAQKPRLSRANFTEYLKVAISTFIKAPQILRHYYSAKAEPHNNLSAKDFIGLGISADDGYQNQTVDLIEELGVKRLLLRIPCWKLDELDQYLEFANRFAERELLINILQDREAVADPEKWESSLEMIFTSFASMTSYFQIGNAVNRTKWGCAHIGEYLALLEIAEQVRSRHPGVQLVGSSVIDFEPLATLRTLWNRKVYRLDQVSALLYVNRRGSPYGRQYKYFDLQNKLRLLNAIVHSGNRNNAGLWITEVNWPLLNTKPYTPNSGHPSRTVDEATQAKYLTQYFQIAYQTGWVDRVYWWELINPGCGLIDHREGSLRKMASYFAFKELLAGTLYEFPVRS